MPSRWVADMVQYLLCAATPASNNSIQANQNTAHSWNPIIMVPRDDYFYFKQWRYTLLDYLFLYWNYSYTV